MTVTDPATHLIHVAAEFSGLAQPTLDLALPTWTPGTYSVENYARNVLRFTITGAAGHPAPFTRVRKQTWRVDTRGLDRVRVTFDYLADRPGLDQAELDSTSGFITGTQLFLEPVGHRARPSTVRFELPVGWKVMSPLAQTSDSLLFRAANYDVLVDAPAQLGRFDVARFEVLGKPHYLVVQPSGALPEDSARKYFHLWNVKRIRPAEMWPYDYSRERESPLLWFSEGVSNYYANLSLFRSGIEAPVPFLNVLGDGVGYVEEVEARRYISPADASVSSWLGYDPPPVFFFNYYAAGQTLGVLL
ncbi:MAG TPA: hypothetical protein VKA84_20410, partial [Gemmatimonadaceae bacterium]|nr:hypothetical protein [Gemmatimonadaceae bacterium]